MSDYKRYFLPGGTYFFTLKTENNYPVFQHQNTVRLLGEIIRQQIKLNPFQNVAMVLLPDHLHAIWTLPPGDIKYSQRWAWIKKEFTKEYLSLGGVEQEISTAKQRHRRRGVWQRRFWEHTIKDEDDLAAHVDYIHWNPIKHGYVTQAKDWPHSTFHKFMQAGSYPENWGSAFSLTQRMQALNNTGE